MQIEVFPTGCGDAICISFTGTSGKLRRILIDSGYMYSYHGELFPWFENFEKDDQVDLWILTHLDADHINGAYAYFSEKGEGLKKGLVQRIWFNFFGKFPIVEDSENVSYDKAINLRDCLNTVGCNDISNEITVDMPPFELDGAKLTILSPDQASYEQLEKEWEIEEAKLLEIEEPEDVAGAIYVKDKETILTLSQAADRREDLSDTTNRSSIAFLLEFNEKSILMLGDAFPSVVIASLESILTERKLEKLKIDFVKLAHHGSIKNYSKKLFDLIECNNFIICSDGYNRSKIPNKETLAKIITRDDKTKPITFFCNYESDRYVDMFEVDKKEIPGLNFSIKYPGVEDKRLFIPMS